MFNNYNKNDEINTEVSDFIDENYANDTIDSLKIVLCKLRLKMHCNLQPVEFQNSI